MQVDIHELESLLKRAAHAPCVDVHKIEARAKIHMARQAHRVIIAAHSKVVAISREYCHLIYFCGVFFEGHGIYSWIAGVLFILSSLALIPEKADELFMEV